MAGRDGKAHVPSVATAVNTSYDTLHRKILDEHHQHRQNPGVKAHKHTTITHTQSNVLEKHAEAPGYFETTLKAIRSYLVPDALA